MSLRTVTLRLTLGVLLGAATLAAFAQDAEAPRRSYTSMLNIDALIDNYARLLARKYDLNEAQDAFTQQFLREKCQAFLDQYRERLFPLVDRMFEVRSGAEISPQEMVAWGQQAQPLFEAAQKLVSAGNNEWREILTPEQRTIHDADLQTMYESFSGTQEQLNRIVRGEMTVEEFRRGQPPRPRPNAPAPQPPPPLSSPPPAQTTPQAAAPPPAPQATATTPPPNPTPNPSPNPMPPANPPPVAKGPPAPPPPPQPPAAGGVKRDEKAQEREALAKLEKLRRDTVSRPPAGAVTPRNPNARAAARPAAAPVPGSAEFESQWEAYVREFIQKYHLTEEQAQRARAILKDCQEQARSRMTQNKTALEDAEKKIKELSAPGPKDKEKDRAKELTEANERKTKLLQPINEIFERLKKRLDALPTRAQRQAAESGPKKDAGRPGGAAKPPGKPGQPVPPQPQPVPQPQPQPVPQPQPQPQPQPVPQPPPPQPVPPPPPEPPPPEQPPPEPPGEPPPEPPPPPPPGSE